FMVYANALSIVVSFATAAYYLAFLAPVSAILILRISNKWSPGGTWAILLGGTDINVLVCAWLTFEFINISLPRDQGLPIWQEWAVVIGFIVCLSIGFVYYKATRPYERMPIE